MPKAETKLQAAIVSALEQFGFDVIRIQCGGVKVRGGYMHLAKAGTPDLLVVLKEPLFLETKTAEGKLSKGQRRRHTELRLRGAIVEIVRGVKEAVGIALSHQMRLG